MANYEELNNDLYKHLLDSFKEPLNELGVNTTGSNNRDLSNQKIMISIESNPSLGKELESLKQLIDLAKTYNQNNLDSKSAHLKLQHEIGKKEIELHSKRLAQLKEQEFIGKTINRDSINELKKIEAEKVKIYEEAANSNFEFSKKQRERLKELDESSMILEAKKTGNIKDQIKVYEELNKAKQSKPINDKIDSIDEKILNLQETQYTNKKGKLSKKDSKQLASLYKEKDMLSALSHAKESGNIKDQLKIYEEQYRKRTSWNEEEINNIDQQLVDLYDKLSTANENEFDKINEEIDELNNKKDKINLGNDLLKNTLERLKNGLKSAVQEVFNVIAKSFDIFIFDRMKKGLTDYNSQYESRFSEIAARNGSSTYSETHGMITDALSTINNDKNLTQSLNFSNDVFPKITEAVQAGFTGDNAVAIAITNSIDKKLMPWLDTNSKTWTHLQYNLSDTEMEILKSAQLGLQDSKMGNRLLQSGVADQLLNSISPLLTDVKNNTTDIKKLPAEQLAMVESLMESGYSESQAVAVANEFAEIYKNPYKYLTSGTVAQQQMAIAAMDEDATFSDMADTLSNVISDNLYGHDAIATGALTSAYGISDAFTNGSTRDGTSIAKAMDNMSDAVSNAQTNSTQAYKDALNRITEYTTATQKYDNKEENKYAEMFKDIPLIAHGADYAEMAIGYLKDIKDFLIKTLIGGFVGDLVGSFLDKGFDKIGNKLGSKLFGGKGGNLFNSGGNPLGGGGNPLTSGGGGGFGQTIKGVGKGIKNFATSKAGGALSIVGGALVAADGITDIIDANKTLEDESVSSTLKEGAKAKKTAGTVATVAGGVGVAAGVASLAGAAAAGPIGLAAVAIGGVALAVGKHIEKMKELDDATAKMTEAFDTAKNNIENEADSREKLYIDLLDGIDNVDSAKEKLDLLSAAGLNTASLQEQTGKTTEALNAEIEKELLLLADKNRLNSEEAVEAIENVEMEYKDKYNDEVDKFKENFINEFSYEALDKKGLSDEEKEKEQRKQLRRLGYDDETIDDLLTAYRNGAAGKDELRKFLDGNYAGNEVSLENMLEQDKTDESSLRFIAKDAGFTTNIFNGEEVAAASEELVTAISYLRDFKDYGSEEGQKKKHKKIPLDFNQEKYDEYKKYIKNINKQQESIALSLWAQYGESGKDANWLKELPGYRIGSQFIPKDMVAVLHKGERVLTDSQNKQYDDMFVNNKHLLEFIKNGFIEISKAFNKSNIFNNKDLSEKELNKSNIFNNKNLSEYNKRMDDLMRANLNGDISEERFIKERKRLENKLNLPEFISNKPIELNEFISKNHKINNNLENEKSYEDLHSTVSNIDVIKTSISDVVSAINVQTDRLLQAINRIKPTTNNPTIPTVKSTKSLIVE